MIKSITITNHLGESITLELRSPEKSGFFIRRVDGLGPSKANINTTDVLTKDGSIYNSARVNQRNIVLTLGLLAKASIEDSRQLLYKYFPIKKQVKIVVETDNRISETYGYVETNELDIFNKEQVAVISIICPNSYFYSAGLQTTTFSGVASQFSFPFSNESLTEKLLAFGQITSLTEQTIYYAGDAEIGVIISIHALASASNLAIHNMYTREEMRIDSAKLIALTGSGIIAGDDIIISTVKGEKFVVLMRSGEFFNILNTLDRNVGWFQLSKGDNVFAYTADSGLSTLQFTVDNKIVYEGI